MGSFRLSDLAEADFDEIAAYSFAQWGEAQATRYMTELDATFAELAQTARMGRARSDLRAGILTHPCNRHLIFFRRSPQGDVEILRILHERMDFPRHM